MKKNITIKKYLILILLMSFSFSSFSQIADIIDVEKYKTIPIPQTFKDRIKGEDLNNFKILRNYLTEKTSLETSLNNLIDKSRYNDDYYLRLTQDKIKTLTDSINSKERKDNDIISLYYKDYEIEEEYPASYYQEPKKHTVKDIKERISKFQNHENELNQKKLEMKTLISNTEKVHQDIQDCQKQIDSALAPENRQQFFKMVMSSVFAILIGLLLVAFFYIVYQKSDNTLSILLLSGYGLQFITLFVLIIAIILFGILDILKGSELAAMLSGISGYILGKGIQDKKLISDNTTPNSTVTPVTIITDPIIPINPDPVPVNPDIQDSVNTVPIPKPNEDTENNNP